MLRSNPRQGVEEMIVACCNHVPTKSFGFGYKNWTISDAALTHVRLTSGREKTYFAEIGVVHRCLVDVM